MWELFCLTTTYLRTFGQIDRLNLEGYANLEQWVAELDKKIELILLKRLTQIVQVWCAEFDRADDNDTRRDHTREMSGKRRSDKRVKDEKVRAFLFAASHLLN